MKQIIVAGCGPAGILAAISAAREGAKVTILEGMEKPGKKLLLTGNGRCNLTNLDPELPKKYYSAGASFETLSEFQKIFEQFSVKDTLDFFHQLGLLTASREGYVYPYTAQSSSVLELLLAELKRLKVKLKLKEKIQKITPADVRPGQKPGDAGWKVSTKTWTYACDSLILCCGSKAVSVTGSDGSGYALAGQLGHSASPVVPALTALMGRESHLSACAGVRCPAAVTLYTEKTSKRTGRDHTAKVPENEMVWQVAARDIGELQWTEHGISGIVVFQVSRFAALALAKGQRVQAELDLLPALSNEELLQALKRSCGQFPEGSLGEVLSGLLPKKLLQVCLGKMKLKPGQKAALLTMEQQMELAKTMKQFLLPITGVRSFDQCQVCAGGISLEEIDPKRLTSRLAENLYFAGEILDIDGPCGGYNLQWAWSSGYVAGKHAALETECN